jgi:Peptide chain release factor 1 (eRF1)
VLAVIDRNEATYATLKGKKETILGHLYQWGPDGKHKAGGRITKKGLYRVIEDLAHQFLKRNWDHMNEAFLPLKDDLKGIILGGPGFTKKRTSMKEIIFNMNLKTRLYPLSTLPILEKRVFVKLSQGLPMIWKILM